MKYVDITLRIPLADEADDSTGLTIAADVRQAIKDNCSDLEIEEVDLVSVHVHSK